MLDHTKPYVEKIHYIDVELAGHVYKSDVKLQSLCGSGFSLFAVCCVHACQALPLWSELTNNTMRNNDGVHIFTLKFKCHNRDNKLLLCNSGYDDIA